MKKLLSLLILLSLAITSHAAISLDGAIQGPAGGAGCGVTSNCPTWSQTFSGSATHAVFFVTTFNATGTVISAITIGGVLTCTTALANDGTHFATSWVVICPLSFTGTQTVAITLNTTPAGGWIAYCQSIIGGDTSGSYVDGGTSGTSIVSSATGTSSTSVSTSTNNNWAFSVFTVSSAATSIAAGSGETQLGSTITGAGSDKWFATYKPNNSSGTVTQTTTWSGGSGFTAKAMLVLKAASGATPASRRRFIGIGAE